MINRNDKHKILNKAFEIHEAGAIKKRWTGKLPIALVYPNKYSVGMGNLAVHMLYFRLNSYEDIVCERVFLAENKNNKIRSIESNRPLVDFKFIFISISFENDFKNLINILRRSDIECDSKKRNYKNIIFVGGPAVTINPKALSNVADMIFVGEVDDVLDNIVKEILNNYNESSALLNRLSEIKGVYNPRISKKIPERNVVKNLDQYPTHSIIDSKTAEFGDMFLIEVGRGCSYSCRYCSVPKIYNPFRIRSVESLWASAQIGLKMGKRIGLICPEILASKSFIQLARKIVEARGKFSTSSIRADHVNEEIANLLALGGMKSVSIGVEAGNETLRKKIGKNISDESIINSVTFLTNAGLKRIKLYFMYGLPNEQRADLDDIISLTKKIILKAKKGSRIEVVLSPFVPKPMTVFEDEPFAGRKYLNEAYDYIRPKIEKMGVGVSSRSIKEAQEEYANSKTIITA